MAFNPHDPGKKPQWLDTPPHRRNWAQRFAAKYGFTPADGITGTGLILRLLAAEKLSHAKETTRKQRLGWLAVSLVGNACDYADGMAAEKLQVKHPQGGNNDAIADFISLNAELIGFMRGGLISPQDALKLGVIKTSNLVATALTKTDENGNGRKVNKYGKAYAMAAGVGIGFKALARAMGSPSGSPQQPADVAEHKLQGAWRVTEFIADGLINAATVAGTIATTLYWKNAIESHIGNYASGQGDADGLLAIDPRLQADVIAFLPRQDISREQQAVNLYEAAQCYDFEQAA